MTVDLEAVRDLMVEAEGIEAHLGPNPYVDYLRANKCRPSPAEAQAIGLLMGARVRDSNGKMQPAITAAQRQFRKERKQRQDDFAAALEAAPWRPWLNVANDNRPAP